MNILVITDNVPIYEGIKKIFEERDIHDLNVSYRHSPTTSAIWNHVDFKDRKLIVDVKADSQILAKNFDLIISAHCKQMFPEFLVKNVRCINIHPGYNPINKGWYPQVFSIIYGLPIGATIHEMDAKLDNGPIIVRELVQYASHHTSEDVYNKVVLTELKLFSDNFESIIYHKYTPIITEESENLFTKRDFNALCEIDLTTQTTFGSAINKLRALTHGEFKNAYFYDDQGKKIFVSIKLERE